MKHVPAVLLVLAAAPALLLVPSPGIGQNAPLGEPGPDRLFQPLDVFGLEYAADPQISPDARLVVYVRRGFDVMSDRGTADLWAVDVRSGEQRPLTTGAATQTSPRWSPDGTRLLYVSSEEGGAEIWLRWMDTGQTAKLTNLTRSPRNLSWSPDGEWIAFTMFVPAKSQPLAVRMPEAPEGADWGPPIRVIDQLNFRSDGDPGFVEEGNTHVFVLPAEGGTPRQLTSGPYDHGAPAWLRDGRSLLVSANRHEQAERDPLNSEIYRVDVATGALTALTDRQGPDGSPTVSPDGRLVAYLGFDDRLQGYQTAELYVMGVNAESRRLLTGDFDRSVDDPVWRPDGRGILFRYDDEGNGKVGFVDLRGNVSKLVDDVQGLSLGRPYSGGQFSVARDGTMAFTHGEPDHPADVAVVDRRGNARRLTRLNRDLLAHKTLATVEEIRYTSAVDGRPIQGWIVKPPGFDASRRYPLILEIHGGPFANYGDRFSAEIQLYAAAGYIVLYTNPRGSSSYGEEFGNLIHHAYPGDDYHDLMAGVDAVIARGYVDPERLFVTGGSGGGVLSAWIVGHTDRFRAAVVQKPVINWYSFVLTADAPAFFYKYWFPGPPWEHAEHYLARSPLSYVGNVTTPTMLLTGELDYRTPMSESEQFYLALKIRDVPAALVRVPDAPHGIANKPSNLIAKVQHILAWFERWDGQEPVRAATR